jgi:protein-tyrosine kinase
MNTPIAPTSFADTFVDASTARIPSSEPRRETFREPPAPHDQRALGGTVIGRDHGLREQNPSILALRSELRLGWFNGGDRKSLAIVSADPRDRNPPVAAQLAVACAAAGDRTLLIDANMREPSLHTLFGIEKALGLSAVLSNNISLRGALLPTRFDTLSVLPAGPSIAHPEALLSLSKLTHLIEEASRSFDLILIDTPCMSMYGDAQVVARAAGGALVTVRRHHTTAAALSRLATDLNSTGTAVVGALFVDS